MKIGDRVKINATGSKAFENKAGTIRDRMHPDYDWAVKVDGSGPIDLYGFNESELEVI